MVNTERDLQLVQNRKHTALDSVVDVLHRVGGRRIAAGILASIAAIGAYAAIDHAAENDSRSALEQTVDPTDRCLIREGVRGTTHILIDEADLFADGSSRIQGMSNKIGQVTREGVDYAVCRPEDATELDDNFIAAEPNVPAASRVSYKEFDELGGVSQDIG